VIHLQSEVQLMASTDTNTRKEVINKNKRSKSQTNVQQNDN